MLVATAVIQLELPAKLQSSNSIQILSLEELQGCLKMCITPQCIKAG